MRTRLSEATRRPGSGLTRVICDVFAHVDDECRGGWGWVLEPHWNRSIAAYELILRGTRDTPRERESVYTAREIAR